MAVPAFATLLHLSTVKQVVYLDGSDTADGMSIVDVPFVTAQSDPEWRFSAISIPFIPASDGSWREPGDINLASLYGIELSGTYKKGTNDVEVIIDNTKAKVPAGYPFTLEQVTMKVKKCVELMYPYDPEIDSKLEIKIIEAQE